MSLAARHKHSYGEVSTWRISPSRLVTSMRAISNAGSTDWPDRFCTELQ
jgi:hypothetical protein